MASSRGVWLLLCAGLAMACDDELHRLQAPAYRSKSSLLEQPWQAPSPALAAMPGMSPSPAAAPAGQEPAPRPAPLEQRDVARHLSLSELFAQSSRLDGVLVSTTGTVVKVNANIRGKNWLHLQDGSKDAAGRSVDLTVVSVDQAGVGAVLRAVGVLETQVDVGMGSVYPVIMMDARLEPVAAEP